MSAQNKKLSLFIGLFGIVILIGWNYGAFSALTDGDSASNSQNNAGPPAVKVIVEPVKTTSNDRIYDGVGTGRARNSADLYPAVAEEVIEVLFEAEQHVKKGDVLVQLDDREEQLALKLAEVELKDARSLLDRYEKAVKQGAVPESEVDAARATFEAAEVAVEQAQLSIEERQIKAPFDGIVGIPNVDPGDRVSTSTLITGLDDRNVLFVDFEVPEALAGALREAQQNRQKISSKTPSYPNKEFEGHIAAQESRLNSERRTVMARANINNEEDLLRPGMSFTARWEISGADYPTVPEISLQWGREGSFVWLIEDNTAKKVMARVIARRAGQVLLDADIQDGAQVVVEGLQRIRPNAKVEILGDEQAQSAEKGQAQ